MSQGQHPAPMGDGRDRHPVTGSDHLPHQAHMHVHVSGCGHERVPHEDHDDYVHGEHRHAPHGTHYDEH